VGGRSERGERDLQNNEEAARASERKKEEKNKKKSLKMSSNEIFAAQLRKALNIFESQT